MVTGLQGFPVVKRKVQFRMEPAQFVQGPQQPFQISPLPVSTSVRSISTLVEIYQEHRTAIVHQYIVGVEIGMIDVMPMEISDRTTDAGPLIVRQRSLPKVLGQGSGIGNSARYEISTIGERRESFAAGGNGLRDRQAKLPHVRQQMELPPHASPPQSRIQVRVFNNMTNHASAPVVLQIHVDAVKTKEPGSTTPRRTLSTSALLCLVIENAGGKNGQHFLIMDDVGIRALVIPDPHDSAE